MTQTPFPNPPEKESPPGRSIRAIHERFKWVRPLTKNYYDLASVHHIDWLRSESDDERQKITALYRVERNELIYDGTIKSAWETALHTITIFVVSKFFEPTMSAITWAIENPISTLLVISAGALLRRVFKSF
jgi:hypothetical protein